MALVALVAVLTPANAQRATEWQAHAHVNVGAERFVGAGVGFALRTNGRMRLGVVLNAGDLEGSAAIRPELLGTFHLNPYRRSGLSPYAGAGMAAILAEGEWREYIVALAGLESRPGLGLGWFAEVGIGGGMRLAAGVQIRNRGSRAR